MSDYKNNIVRISFVCVLYFISHPSSVLDWLCLFRRVNHRAQHETAVSCYVLSFTHIFFSASFVGLGGERRGRGGLIGGAAVCEYRLTLLSSNIYYAFEVGVIQRRCAAVSVSSLRNDVKCSV